MKLWAIIFLVSFLIDLATDISMCICVGKMGGRQHRISFFNEGDDVCPGMEIERSRSDKDSISAANRMIKFNTQLNSITTMGMVISGLIMAIKILGGSN